MFCSARHCATPISKSKEFCDEHWSVLPDAMKTKLCDSYGTPDWVLEMKKCQRTLFLLWSQNQVTDSTPGSERAA